MLHLVTLLSALRDGSHFFSCAIRRCLLVRILCALGQQPVLTIEYLKGEFYFVPNFFRCGFSPYLSNLSLAFVCLFGAVVVFHAKEGKNGEMLRFLDLEIHIVTTKNSGQTRHLQPCVFKFIHIIISISAIVNHCHFPMCSCHLSSAVRQH